MSAEDHSVSCISYARDILPLFKLRDFGCMSDLGVHLDSYAYISAADGDAVFPDHANVRHILSRLQAIGGRRMPPGNPWTIEQIDLLRNWLETGCKA